MNVNKSNLILKLLFSVSDEEEANEEDNLLDDNDRLDDDDAPDSVDFATSKITVMQQFRWVASWLRKKS